MSHYTAHHTRFKFRNTAPVEIVGFFKQLTAGSVGDSSVMNNLRRDAGSIFPGLSSDSLFEMLLQRNPAFERYNIGSHRFDPSDGTHAFDFLASSKYGNPSKILPFLEVLRPYLVLQYQEIVHRSIYENDDFEMVLFFCDENEMFALAQGYRYDTSNDLLHPYNQRHADEVLWFPPMRLHEIHRASSKPRKRSVDF